MAFRVGLLTAILSPVINHLLFDMPSEAVLPIILDKINFDLPVPPPFAAHRKTTVYFVSW